MITNNKLLLAVAAIMLMLPSCKNDDESVVNPNPTHESELITTMKLIVSDSATGGHVTTAMFKDTDGEGGNGPSQFDTLLLSPNKTYNVEVLLLDESNTPVDTISHEVEEEGAEHQFFYSTSGANISVTYLDVDTNGVPVGLHVRFNTGTATTNKNGKLKVVLKHQGEVKPNTGTGDPAIGDTDIEVDFPVLLLY